PFDVYALSLWLGTSYTATARQLAATMLADRVTADTWARIPPRAVKRSLVGDLAPDDLRNDVWWLRLGQDVEQVEARPGDRLVLTLDETPATGYSWDFQELSPGLRLLADSYVNNWEPQLVAEMATQHLELDGAMHPRAFVLEVDQDLGMSDH